MNTYNEKKRIRQAIEITVLIGLFFFVIGIFFVREVISTQNHESEQYLAEIAVQYKNTIEKQIEGDLQTLTTVATYISQSEMDKEAIINQLLIENLQNPFLRMSYVTPDKLAQIVDINGTIYYDVDVSDETFIIQALNGENAISNPFQDKLTNQYLTAYAVPIVVNGTTMGVITGINTASTFSQILETSIFSGAGSAFIINSSTGNVVSRSSQSSLKADITNIYLDTQLSDKTKSALKQDIKNGQNSFFTFEDDSKEYWATYQKSDINDWYILIAVPKEVVNKNFMQLIQVSIMIGLSILSLSIISCVLITRNMRKSHESVTKLAYHDDLTGIYNKNRFHLELIKLLKTDRHYALVILNIKNFKFFNELFGFANGDYLLKHIANMLSHYSHTDEVYYRESADRFGFLIHSINEEVIIKRMNVLIEAISDYVLPGEQFYSIICNYGVKILDEHSKKLDIDLTQDRATSALQRAIQLNLPYYFYNEELHEVAQWKNHIEKRMYEALENHEYIIYLQPKILLADESIEGAEALVRWRQPDGTILFPDQFISIFETNTFITHLDLYILESVCELIEEWLKQGQPVIPISVNQSRLLFYQEDYLDNIKNILIRHPIPPHYLKLEVTESMMSENIEDIENIIEQLHCLGLIVSLDDFGSGYSSLNVLKELSIDELKLDKVFLSDSKHQQKSNRIMETTIRLVNELGIDSLMEGVETKEQVDFLKTIGCKIAQGYYYSKPLPIEDFKKFTFKK